MRKDGRANDALRQVTISPNCLEYADGSALIVCGKTRVLCAASIEATVPPWMQGRGTGWVTGEIVDCDVIQADGGTRTASVTGGLVALHLALKRLIGDGLIPEGVLGSPVAAVSVGLVDGEALLDLCYEEDSRAAVDFNVVMNARGEFIEVQGTAEGRPFSKGRLDELLDLAKRGIDQLIILQRQVMQR